MTDVRGCDLPADLYYLVEKHVWARLEPDGLVPGELGAPADLPKTGKAGLDQ